MRLAAFLCTTFAIIVAGDARVAAQPTSECPSMEEAMAYFQAGLAQIRVGRSADAIESFNESYRLCPRPTSLFNRAIAENNVNRFVAACATFDEFIREFGHLNTVPPQEAQSSRDAACSKVITLVIEDLPTARGFVVRLDGVQIEMSRTRPIEMRADPGHHAITVTHHDYQTFDWEADVREGQRVIVPLELVEIPQPQIVGIDLPHDEEEDERRRPWYRHAGFWVPMSLAIVGGASFLGYALKQRADNTASGSPLYPDHVVNLEEFR